MEAEEGDRLCGPTDTATAPSIAAGTQPHPTHRRTRPTHAILECHDQRVMELPGAGQHHAVGRSGDSRPRGCESPEAVWGLFIVGADPIGRLLLLCGIE